MAREKKTPRKKSPMSVAITALRGLFDADDLAPGRHCIDEEIHRTAGRKGASRLMSLP
ncbi:MAG: hypothetical protein ABR915_16610 [Thermoguttaceae bacterium]